MNAASAGLPFVAVTGTARSGEMTPLHVHDREEALEVLEGTVVLHVGDETMRLDAGTTLVTPAGVPHAFRVESSVARYISSARAVSAGRYEDFLCAVARPAAMNEDEVALLAVLGVPNGIAVLGSPGALPAGGGSRA